MLYRFMNGTSKVASGYERPFLELYFPEGREVGQKPVIRAGQGVEDNFAVGLRARDRGERRNKITCPQAEEA